MTLQVHGAGRDQRHNALLAGARQVNAMIDFAKMPGIKNAIAYRKHPSGCNMLDSGGVVPSISFCQKVLRNAELNDVVNGQLQGVDPIQRLSHILKTELPGKPRAFFPPPPSPLPFYLAGTCPFGKTTDVATCTCN